MMIINLINDYLAYLAFVRVEVLYVLLALLGLVFGSFLNVVIFRGILKCHAAEEEYIKARTREYFKKGRSWPTPNADKLNELYSNSSTRSQCLSCGYKLNWWNNIPLISFVFQRGKCVNCGVRLSFQYPAVELAASVLSVVSCGLVFNGVVDLAYISYMVMVFLGLVIISIDLKEKFIIDHHNNLFFALTPITLWLAEFEAPNLVEVLAVAATTLVVFHILVFVPLAIVCQKDASLGEGDYPLVFSGFVLCGLLSDLAEVDYDFISMMSMYGFALAGIALLVAGCLKLVGRGAGGAVPFAPSLVVCNLIGVGVIIAI